MSLAEDLLPHMRRVQVVDRDLHDLSLLWQMIEASSAIACPDEAESVLPTLTQTRERFAELQQQLLHQLAEEHLAAVGEELLSAARCASATLGRSLHERRADAACLAGDEMLRAFCAAAQAQRNEVLPMLLHRLTDFQRLYSLYDDILLLAPDGTVLTRLDEQPVPAVSRDPLLAQALARQGVVQRFGPTDMATDGAEALLHAHRVLGRRGEPVGVLVLRLALADEVRRIFGSSSRDAHRVVLCLLDAEGRVLMGNDPAHVNAGALLQTGGDGELAPTLFGGRDYLSVTCGGAPGAGVGLGGGPAWRVQALISLQTAFRSTAEADITNAGRRHVALDNPALRQIQRDVDSINRNLRRVVWNGRVMIGGQAVDGGPQQAQLKAVLGQVTAAGLRTRDRVALAIGDLYQTALGRAISQSQELARLAADGMERCLYERANGCRWWTRSPLLLRRLAARADAAGSHDLGRWLAHLKDLYPVYSRLLVFDADGQVRALSDDDADVSSLGQPVPPAWLQRLQALNDGQRYAVTPFEAAALSGDAPAFTFLAAVREPASRRLLGGVAAVFDAATVLRTLLADTLGGRAGVAAFVDAEGRVLASTDPALTPLVPLPFMEGLAGHAGIVDHADEHLAVARVRAEGYREFKRGDGYSNGVSAVVALRLGTQERRRRALHETALRPLPLAHRAERRELALFEIGGSRYALPPGSVIQALPPRGLVRSPARQGLFAGLLEVPGERGSVVVPVLCGRLLMGVRYPAREADGVVLVLPAAPGQTQPAFGLRVDDVTMVTEVGAAHLQPVPLELRGHAEQVACVARLASGADGEGSALVQVMDFAALLQAAGLRRPVLAA